MSDFSAFPKIYHVGKHEIQNLFLGDVEITEKVDGSQFVWGRNAAGDLVFRSKGKEMYFGAYEKMFVEAVAVLDSKRELINKVLAPSTYVYCEYLQKPKHNVLAYERIPRNHLIVFGVKEGLNFVNEYHRIKLYADQLDLEVVPLLHTGQVDYTLDEDGIPKGYKWLKELVATTSSVLGGTTVEGIVIKNYYQHTSIGDPTICCGKYVREDFKERLHKEWKPQTSDLETFIASFRTEARWQKAIQHLRETGELEHSPRDIGKIIQEVNRDISEEEHNTIKHFLYRHFIKMILRKATAGVAEYYKDQLLQSSFHVENSSTGN